jgi:effector-binding domain-containing protein
MITGKAPTNAWARLTHEAEEDTLIDTPRITETTEQRAAVIHMRIPREEMPKVFGAAVEELLGTLADQDVAVTGPVFAHHLRMEPDTFDFEVGVPVAGEVAESGRVKPGGLPAATVARTVHRGPYEGLPGAWGEFDSWMREKGHSQGPDLWERYLEGPGSSADPADWVTELNRPLEGVS